MRLTGLRCTTIKDTGKIRLILRSRKEAVKYTLSLARSSFRLLRREILFAAAMIRPRTRKSIR